MSKEITANSDAKMRKALEAVTREFGVIRTGRASPSLVEGIVVEYYGTPTPIKQLGSISIPDSRLIVIQPWDASVLDEIEKAINKSNLGISPVNDGKVLRLSIPQLSQERRAELTKIVKKVAEDGHISLRTVRRESKELIEKEEKDKKISEDDKFKALDELQKLTDKYIKQVDDLLAAKDKELMQI